MGSNSAQVWLFNSSNSRSVGLETRKSSNISGYISALRKCPVTSTIIYYWMCLYLWNDKYSTKVYVIRNRECLLSTSSKTGVKSPFLCVIKFTERFSIHGSYVVLLQLGFRKLRIRSRGVSEYVFISFLTRGPENISFLVPSMLVRPTIVLFWELYYDGGERP